MKATIWLIAITMSAAAVLPGCGEPAGTDTTILKDSTDKFADNIRKSDFQSPEEERKGFRLPPGFEITLFASEPDISKPINMEFDERGRLWVTTTVEYPKPAAPGRGRDRIVILEDRDQDGRADTFTPFVDSLNIPIGITPVYKGAIAYSIPNIYKFIDRNGDLRADETTKLVGPFEFVDTHGMVNNLVRGYDGWVYACHGYANTSTVAGSDGDSITMNSGNTFRFREDGSRVEATTFGRINPFGYAFDEWGYLYSLDCHTKPIYQLIAGAQYPSQGVKEPAIGWAPIMMSYEFGSTANSGLVYYTGTQFPEAFQQNFFSGNVVTSRINRNTMTFQGSSPGSKREEDFLISDDPWFRPVDIKTGPDGSLYVADFYNRIIGHYEVPKDHPGRDKTSGRIWKITYKGTKAAGQAKAQDWSQRTVSELVSALNFPQLNERMKIANHLVDAYGKQAVEPVKRLMSETSPDSRAFVQGLWILFRLRALPDELLQKALQHNNPMVQVHGLRVLSELKFISTPQRELVRKALVADNPHVQRMAAMVSGRFPVFTDLPAAMEVYLRAGERDSHLKYTAIIAIKEYLNKPDILQKVTRQHWREEQLALIMSVIPEVPSREAAMYALDYLKTHRIAADKFAVYLQFISRYISRDVLDNLVQTARKNALNDPDAEFNYYDAIRQGVARQGGAANASLKKWGTALAERSLRNPKDSAYRQVQASRIVTDYKLMALQAPLQHLLTSRSSDLKARVAAAEALIDLSPQNLVYLVQVFKDTLEESALREKLAITMARVQTPDVYAMLGKVLPGSPFNLQLSIATVLSASGQAIDYLLAALKAHYLQPAVLDDIRIKENITANISPRQRKELSALTAGKLGSENRKELIMARLASFDPSAVDIETGRKTFVANCSMCHSIGNKGGNIGPNLTGIGTWGAVALAEKILDPNSNISEAFRTYTINLRDGRTMSGLFRREEGELVVFADLSGQEFSVPAIEIREKTPSKSTLMPDHFRNTISKKDFDALLKYLLSIKENQ